MNKILVMGSGSWGTALVKILLEDSNVQVEWWVRSEESAAYINAKGRNQKYLRSVKFDMSRLRASSDAVSLVKANDIILLVTPSAFISDVMGPIDNSLLAGKKIISAIKGVEPQTLKIVGEYLFENKGVKEDDFGVITGPCHAEEVAQEKLSYLTFASTNEDFCAKMCISLDCSFIKVTPSADIYGTEISAVLKNVYAIAAGMCHSLGYGDNFQAVLVSNAIREIKRFIAAVHPIDRDADDSAYLGDLLVTAYSQYSRNRTLGGMLGKGYSIKSALVEMEMVAEGYYATESIHKLNDKYTVDMPILNFVYGVIYEKKNIREEAENLTKLLN
ncbi:NAD(P)H-dependent glycerol-3-phosphate dehydrogenase [Bacteroidia bacterium]|nr:NAD(P)H-dependent glycerol-3-phosphate dehydrogenase [Bacteroidia bacterium]MDB9881763.1 NAD(P)H-dependent glycerol-3-phosphate dehydrogenase [Bacteroidia bacterium]